MKTFGVGYDETEALPCALAWVHGGSAGRAVSRRARSDDLIAH